MTYEWEIVLAGAIVPVVYGSPAQNTTASDVREMITARKGALGDGIFVRPEAVLAVVRKNTGGTTNEVQP